MSGNRRSEVVDFTVLSAYRILCTFWDSDDQPVEERNIGYLTRVVDEGRGGLIANNGTTYAKAEPLSDYYFSAFNSSDSERMLMRLEAYGFELEYIPSDSVPSDDTVAFLFVGYREGFIPPWYSIES